MAEVKLEDVLQEEFPTLRQDEPVKQALQLFEEGAQGIVVVNSTGRYHGMLSPNDALEGGLKTLDVPIKEVARKISPLNDREEFVPDDFARKLHAADVRFLPVLNTDEKPIGVIYDLDVISYLDAEDITKKTEIGSLVEGQTLAYFRARDELAKAFALVRNSPFSHVPVFDDEKEELIGQITTRDLCIALNRRRAREGDITAGDPGWKRVSVEGFASEPRIVEASTSLHQVITIMREEDRHAVLIDLGNSIGPDRYRVVTSRDIIKFLLDLAVTDAYRVWVTGHPDEDIKEIAADAALRVMEKFQRFLGSEAEMFIRFKMNPHQSSGGMFSWTCMIRLSSAEGHVFNAEYTAFGADNAFNEAIDRLERQISEKKERMIDRHRSQKIHD